MKKIFCILLASLTIVSCSQHSNSGTSEMASSDTGKAGSLARFTIIGNYMYTVDYSQLKVFNLNTPDNPVLVNSVNIGFDIETIFAYREYLYIGSNSGMFIFSVSNPENPSYVSDAQHFTSCDPVVANDQYAFVTLHSETRCGNNVNSLEIYDISDVTAPVLVSTRNLTYPKGLGLFHNFLFVCDDEVKVFDVSDPVNSTLVASINVEAFDVIINGDRVILIGESGLYQYQIGTYSMSEIQELSSISI